VTKPIFFSPKTRYYSTTPEEKAENVLVQLQLPIS